jgi:hypothetical protein
MMDPVANFVELIQLHERQWGMEKYPHRPSLDSLLNSPIVAVWTAGSKPSEGKRATANATPERFMLTTHQSYSELDDIVASIVMVGSPSFASNWRLYKLFLYQKVVKVRIRVEVPEIEPK